MHCAVRTLFAGLFSASALGIGRFLLAIIVKKELRTLERTLLSFTIGLVFYYHLMFLMGVMHAFSVPLIRALAVLPAALILVRRDIRMVPRMAQRRLHLTHGQCLVLCFLSVLVFYSFLISLNPVTHYDALTNHIAVPMEYLLRHGIEPIPYNMHADLPPASHMINLILIAAFGNAESVQLFNFFVVLFAGVAACSLSNRKDYARGLLGFCFFLVIPQVSLLLSLCNIDFLATLFSAASVVICFHLEAIGTRRAFILLAIHVSFLLALKYQTSIFVVLILVHLILVGKYPSRPGFKDLTLFLLLLAGLVFPFLLKNYLFTGDPVFPFLSRIIPITSATPQEIGFLLAENGGQRGFPDPGAYARTLWGIFSTQPETGTVVVLLAVVAVSYRRLQHRNKSLLLWLSLGPALILAFLSKNVVNDIRWNQYSQFMLCILAGLSVGKGFRVSRRILTAAVGTILILSFCLSVFVNWRLTQSLKVSAGLWSEDQYRTVYIPSFSLRKRLSGLTGKILFIGQSRDYLNAENSIVPSAHNSYYIESFFQNAADIDQLARNFRNGGFNYLFVTIPDVNKLLSGGRYKWMTPGQYKLLQMLVVKRSIGYDGISVIVRL